MEALTPEGFVHPSASRQYTFTVGGQDVFAPPQNSTGYEEYTWTSGVVDEFKFSITEMKADENFGEVVFELLELLVEDLKDRLKLFAAPRLQELIDATQTPPHINLKKLIEICHAHAGAGANLYMWGLASPAKMLEVAMKRISGLDTQRTQSGEFCWPQQPCALTAEDVAMIETLVRHITERAEWIVAWWDEYGNKLSAEAGGEAQ